MKLKMIPLFVAGAVLMAGCVDDVVAPNDAPSLAMSAGSGTYVILGKANKLPTNLEAKVAAAGGELIGAHPEIGVAFARSSVGDFASRIGKDSGVESVSPDVELTWIDPTVARGEPIDAAELEAMAAVVGTNETFYSFQWVPRAMQADLAWAAGYTGKGVRVAILDGGIFDQHLDLTDNLDRSVSRAFHGPAGFSPSSWNTDIGTFWHGTHVAGIVGAAANNLGTIGIAPEATLIGVKVLHNGSGPFSAIINGIMYAARPIAEGGAGAHVLNMSLRGIVDEKDQTAGNKTAVRELMKAIDRATVYAYQQGATVIAAAGNDGANMDVFKDFAITPAMNQNVISISSTGPHGWALGATNFERPAYYTNYGKSLVDLAAPGGTVGLWLIDGVDQICTVTGTFVTLTRFCEEFDMVMSTVRGTTLASYNWAQGTSMAAPAVAGVAALIIQKGGGTMQPSQVHARLRQGAIDYGAPGNDEFYGHGWVNAWQSVQ